MAPTRSTAVTLRRATRISTPACARKTRSGACAISPTYRIWRNATALRSKKLWRCRPTISASYFAARSRCAAASRPHAGRPMQRVELDRLHAALDRRLPQIAAGDVEAAGFGPGPRYDQHAIKLLGQALQARAGVHRVADCGDDLRARRPHGA